MPKVGIFVVIAIIIASVALIGLTQLQGQAQSQYSANVVSALNDSDSSGFAQATTVRDFTFPRDHGAHPDYQTEWWYYTGNLATTDGRRFGFEFTIFRRGLTPTAPVRTSDWATNQVYFADLAISDMGANQFYSTERFSRGAVDLAGATVDPRFRVWIEDWTIIAQTDDATILHLKAADGPIALDLTTHQIKPPTLQGDRGLSVRSAEPGKASYYYSLTRLPTDGILTVNGTLYTVSGNTWMDHEFSTGYLGKDALGWDWFSLQLDNQREVMLFQIRKWDGSIETVVDGKLIEADGSTTTLKTTDYTVEALSHWTSPRTGATYPSAWRIKIQAPTGPIELEVTPLIADQELTSTTVYWEGASQIKGTDNGKPVTGYGYVELTGYAHAFDQKEALTRQGQ